MRWRRHAAAAWPFALLTSAYLLTALRVIDTHGPLYFGDWQDQLLYIRSARALVALNFTPAEHYYPLLYPLLGTPFLRVWPSQPFFIVDLACYLLAFHGFRGVARAFGLPDWAAMLLFAATTIAQFAFAKTWIEPWTSTPSAALLWLALGATAGLWTRATSLHAPPRRTPGPSGTDGNDEAQLLFSSRARLGPGFRRGGAFIVAHGDAIVLGLALGLIVFARPGDAIVASFIALSGGAAAYRLGRATILCATAAFIVSAGVMTMLYGVIYGLKPSPYMLYSAQYGFNFAWFGWKAYVLLVDPRDWFGEGTGLLERAPWLLLGGAGLIASAFAMPPRQRPIVLTGAVVGIAHVVLLLAYVDLLPTGLWRYNNIHYFKWVLPLFGLFAVRFVLLAWRRPVLLAAVLPVLLALTIRPEPVRVAADAPARMVIFPAPVGAVGPSTYFATAWVTDTSGEQRNSFDYHQILVAGRVRAVALRRPFVGNERWIGDDHVRAQLEGRDTGAYAPLYLTGPWPKTPLARYGMRVTVGLPRWFRNDEAPPQD